METLPRAVLPQEIMTGGDLPPVLPVLGAALDAGAASSEHVRGVVATMGKLPSVLPAGDRDLWETFLVQQAGKLHPRQLETGVLLCGFHHAEIHQSQW